MLVGRARRRARRRPDEARAGETRGAERGAVFLRFHLATAPESIDASSVELADGTRIRCDLVVLGVGVKPRIALAEAAGIAVDAGIVVDEQLRTSAPSVWAAGDVARYADPRLAGERVRIEHWVVAERQGQAAARSMLGRGTAYRDVPFFWSAHYDTTVAYVGHAPKWDALEVAGSIEGRDAAIASRCAGRVLAVATLNRDVTSLRVEAAMFGATTSLSKQHSAAEHQARLAQQGTSKRAADRCSSRTRCVSRASSGFGRVARHFM